MFKDWLIGMREDRLTYYRKNMLIKQKCYMGFGMRHDHHRGWCMRHCMKCCFCVHRGLLADFAVHAANHHPLFSPYFAHKDHPYTKYEKLVALYVSTMTTFACTGLCLLLFPQAEGAAVIVLNMIVVVPTMIMTTLMYYLMACPCAVHDESSSSDCKNWCLARLDSIGSSCGKIMLLIGATMVSFIRTTLDPLYLVVIVSSSCSSFGLSNYRWL